MRQRNFITKGNFELELEDNTKFITNKLLLIVFAI